MRLRCPAFAVAPFVFAIVVAAQDIKLRGATVSGGLSTPDKPLGNATLSVTSGFSGAHNPLAHDHYGILRSSYADALAQGGVTVPAGMSPYKYVALACAKDRLIETYKMVLRDAGESSGPEPRTTSCHNVVAAFRSSEASTVRADKSGRGTLPGVPPGTYYLMISAMVNGQPLAWDQAITLRAGANSVTLNATNAHPMR